MSSSQPVQHHLSIRPFQPADWPLVWPIVEAVVRAGDTFTYDTDLAQGAARAVWCEAPPGLTVVAEAEGRVLGTAKMSRNRGGPGAHVATASFMVDRAERGRGVGTALCCFAIDWARSHGFAGLQFNAVAAANTRALGVYHRLGFRTVGSVPGGFRHPLTGSCDLLVLYLPLREESGRSGDRSP
jgi:GNAT superfamily N-acetyltransferase